MRLLLLLDKAALITLTALLLASLLTSQVVSGFVSVQKKQNNKKAQLLMTSRNGRRRTTTTPYYYYYYRIPSGGGPSSSSSSSSWSSVRDYSAYSSSRRIAVGPSRKVTWLPCNAAAEYSGGEYDATTSSSSSAAAAAAKSSSSSSSSSSAASITHHHLQVTTTAAADASAAMGAAADLDTRNMMREITALALPSLGGMLIDPLMSLVDTACVGQISFVQLASLAPCTSIYQFIFLACFFLSATVTNLVASNPYNQIINNNNKIHTNATTASTAENKNNAAIIAAAATAAAATTSTNTTTAMQQQIRLRDDYNERVVSSASILALGLGTLLAVLLVVFANPLLIAAGCPGSGSTDKMLFHAKRYLCIRAVGLPFVLVATVLQGASLACHDAWTPLRIFAVAGLLNVVGDVVLTLQLGMGATGAAIATTTAQAIAALYYVYKSMRLKKNSTKDAPTKGHNSNHNNNSRIQQQQQQQTRGVPLAWKGPPSRQMIRAFWPVALSVLLRECGNMTAYSLLTRTAAGMGATVLAAHQVTLQVWWLLSYIPEPNVVAAQTLIARDMQTRPWRVPKLVKLLFAMTLGMGIAVAALTGLVLSLPMLARAIVADTSVRALLRQTAPYAVLAQITCCVGEMTGGVCVGSGNLKHLPASAIGATCALAGALHFVTTTTSTTTGASVSNIWLCSNLFFVFRFLGFLLPSQKTRQFLFSRGR